MFPEVWMRRRGPLDHPEDFPRRSAGVVVAQNFRDPLATQAGIAAAALGLRWWWGRRGPWHTGRCGEAQDGRSRAGGSRRALRRARTAAHLGGKAWLWYCWVWSGLGELEVEKAGALELFCELSNLAETTTSDGHA